MGIWRRYRFLIVICVLVAFISLWEPPGQYENPEDAMQSYFEKKKTVEVLSDIYREGDEVFRMAAITQAKQGNLAEARKLFERALATGIKTNEDNFYLYAVTLVAMDAPQEDIDKAVADWKFNFPFSNRRDPRDEQAVKEFLQSSIPAEGQ